MKSKCGGDRLVHERKNCVVAVWKEKVKKKKRKKKRDIKVAEKEGKKKKKKKFLD